MSTHSANTLAGRKARHLEVCLQDPVEGPRRGWDQIEFYHRSLPELHRDELDLGRSFLGKPQKLPFFISCMTGGSDEGFKMNRILAQGAQEMGVPVGMGSMRILFRSPEVFPHFHLRPWAPDAVILSNLGAVQIRDMDHQEIFEMNRRLEVDAQVIHLNPGQELFQDQGDRDFRGVRDRIAAFIKASPLPVILKETGFGIPPVEVQYFLSRGAAYVDLAGAGGTNWLTVEALREDPETQESAELFRDWGHGTAVLLGALKDLAPGKVLASGGLRSGLDLAKSLALGAHLGGLALPFLKAAAAGGLEGILALGERLKRELETVLVLTGSKTLDQLKAQPLYTSLDFEHRVNWLKSTWEGPL